MTQREGGWHLWYLKIPRNCRRKMREYRQAWRDNATFAGADQVRYLVRLTEWELPELVSAEWTERLIRQGQVR